ncbi:MAG: hypothetical protein H0W15_10200 [Gemmatimonadales bacterium]|nr:hypothetical protein [Gemmatimonadales bacterium]
MAMLRDVRACAAALLVIVPVLLVACDGSAAPKPPVAAVVDHRDTASRPAATATPPPATVDTPHAALLAVEAEGLRLVLVPSGSTRQLPFGTPRRRLLEMVTASVRGEAPELGENIDCRATVASWRTSGLQLWFATDTAARFIGWSVAAGAIDPTPDARGPAPTTMSGIGVGSTRAEVESAYSAKVRKSTLGIEFNAGGLAGLLASERADARIVHFWAGQVCLAR